MTAVSSIFLGILQGLTEFLPVSSSGHLVLAQHLFKGFSQPGVLFDVILHAGTLLSVLIYFRNDILKLKYSYIVKIIIATLPAVFVGLIFRSNLESFFSNIRIVGFALIITGILNFASDKIETKKKVLNNYDALLVGVAQAAAIVPGISRSGSTIFTAVSRKVDRKKAAKFSFLLSVPAVFGANILEIVSHSPISSDGFGFYILGFLAAFISGLLAIRVVFYYLAHKNFKWFGIYCLILGILTLLI